MKDQPTVSADLLRPVLASGVRLHGEMPDVGFTTKQWLIERNGQFLQVSELLYIVAEQMDGTRTVADIAAAVTDRFEWALEAEHVQHLIDKKLRPLGLLSGADADVAAPPALAAEGSSPLRLNMRLRMFPPQFVERLTRVLQYAYAPAVLIPIAALIVVAHWWLYSVGGVQRGIESALYRPGGLAAVLALTIAAGLFHELGHSSALRYGGGSPRGIGFGLYLIFPAFYSDVTDSYRLGRLARIRTDLGGIYFHLIFAAGLIGIARWTGNDFLLAAALLFNLEAVRQFIPLVRLDGYWLLADLTGVPDFLSQIRTFVHSVRPARRKRPALPQFKPWVTVAFGLYILLSIPATVYLVALMTMYVPELAALTQKALLVQSHLWSATPEALTRVLIALQIVLIPLPIAATSYFLYVMLTSIGTQIAARYGWDATAVRVRRLAGATTLAGAAAFVALAWAPAASGPSAAFASMNAKPVDPAVLLQRAQDATSRAHTLEADLTGAIGDEAVTGTLALSRPNRARVEVRGAADSLGTFNVVSDGVRLFVFFIEDRKYTETKAAADGSNITAFIVDHVRAFFKPERLAPRAGHHLAYLGQEELQGAVYDVVEMRATTKDGDTWRYYMSPDDHLLHRVAMTGSGEGKRSKRIVHLTNIRINGVIDEARFRWAPPADATALGVETLGVALPLPGSK